MKSLDFNRCAFSICTAMILLAGCGAFRQAQDGVQPPIAAPGMVPQSFAGAPGRSLVHRAGMYRVLYSFAGGSDGEAPLASLIDVHGTLYGTTYAGGAYGNGTVFSITPSGTEQVLYNFAGSPDGASPAASLVDVNGTLYGTTTEGGAYDGGTVFSITPAGTEQVLYSFKGHDGYYPSASLISVNGTLYGTSQGGGSGYGTVVRIRISTGKGRVLHSFTGRPDGAYPAASLINVKGTLYGTTSGGGASTCGGSGCGTVFSVSMAGAEHVVYSFSGPFRDGQNPVASLIEVSGALYGTTYAGGKNDQGTVFCITRAGGERVLHTFSGGSGWGPSASLIDVNGTLYGTTHIGGTYDRGTVFALSP
jgi:uncharacterized repeat protein (TIGR03803 family)